MPPTIVHVVGARPQFVKAAVVLEANQGRWRDVLVHTGQHYDHALSEIFFDELGIPRADINLNVGSERESLGGLLPLAFLLALFSIFFLFFFFSFSFSFPLFLSILLPFSRQ